MIPLQGIKDVRVYIFTTIMEALQAFVVVVVLQIAIKACSAFIIVVYVNDKDRFFPDPAGIVYV
jgi:hypothetical protein